jgi:hypothetical protein
MEFYIGSEIEIRPPVPAEKVMGTRYVADDTGDTDSEVIVIVDDEDHSTIVPTSGERESTRPGSIVGDVQGLVDLLGPGYAYGGELRIDDPTGQPPSRVRVVEDGNRWRAVQEKAEYVYASDYAIPAGPAVVLNGEAAKAWLTDVLGGGVVRAGEYNVNPDGMYDPIRHSPSDWLARMLADLTAAEPAAPHVWRCVPGVDVEVVQTTGVEVVEAHGAAVLVVVVGGLRLASRWLTADELATFDADEDGEPKVSQVDAAVEALESAARVVNDVVERHRAVRAADVAARTTLCVVPSLASRLSLADAECALRTLADLWDGRDPHDVLSTRQREVADRVAALAAADDAEEVGETEGMDGDEGPAEHPA